MYPAEVTRILPEFCQDFVKQFVGFSWKFSRILPAFLFYQNFAKILLEFCQDFFQNSARILSAFCQNLARILLVFCQDFASVGTILLEFCKDFTRIFQNSTRILPGFRQNFTRTPTTQPTTTANTTNQKSNTPQQHMCNLNSIVSFGLQLFRHKFDDKSFVD